MPSLESSFSSTFFSSFASAAGAAAAAAPHLEAATAAAPPPYGFDIISGRGKVTAQNNQQISSDDLHFWLVRLGFCCCDRVVC
ncbi:hypothetical protein MtrunA17_Chr8g0348741 [Medicago truncatula]|uniref:Uncharacterized protein n=1 Tax=Medicago truncatula TaxID=3880 RepID=G7LAX6_MEDTR|nr:hypothetical protein MTR_8g030480 [Medicago truncatula]RHN39880.1 hypothetical protein MtrunA17_Chr8g0348741 [Medicago truncatula]